MDSSGGRERKEDRNSCFRGSFDYVIDGSRVGLAFISSELFHNVFRLFVVIDTFQ